jgi:hypothetical protein
LVDPLFEGTIITGKRWSDVYGPDLIVIMREEKKTESKRMYAGCIIF